MTPEERAQQLINEGYYQVSRSFRTVARLPHGKTGVQALTEAAKEMRSDAASWANRLGEAEAADQYLRVYAREDWLELDIPTFDAFRKLGGGTAMQKIYERGRDWTTMRRPS